MSDGTPLAGYAAELVRGIAACMLDPHRYFEQQLLGELSQAGDDAACLDFIRRLAGWLDDQLLSPAQRDALDRRLAGEGLPSSRLAAAQPQLLAVLLAGGACPEQAGALRRVAEQPGLTPTDRRLLQRALRELPGC